MFDAVLTHCSARSEMFQEFLNGNPAYRNFFIAYASPDELTDEQHRKIFQPRTSDILIRFETIHGPRNVWTTFSPDQVDLNFRNPAVPLQVLDSILFYIRSGPFILAGNSGYCAFRPGYLPSGERPRRATSPI